MSAREAEVAALAHYFNVDVTTDFARSKK